MSTILGVEIDTLPYFEGVIVETPVNVNGYRAALISGIARKDRIILARPGDEILAENIVLIPLEPHGFTLEHLGKKHGEHVPTFRLRPGCIHIRLQNGTLLTDVADMASRLQAVHNLMSRHDIMLDLDEAQRVTHMTGRATYHAGKERFTPRLTPLRGNGVPPP